MQKRPPMGGSRGSDHGDDTGCWIGPASLTPSDQTAQVSCEKANSAQRSAWRDKYKVHPFADVFPPMSDLELDALGKDIKANGLKHPIIFWDTNKGTPEFQRFLIDGRNRMEAMERIGFNLDLSKHKKFIDGDPVAAVMSFNVHRRHLSKQERADAIVAWIATIEADNKPSQAGPVSEAKGGRGKRSPIKEKALALNAELPQEEQVSERTIKRAIAKAEAKTPERTPRRRIVTRDREEQLAKARDERVGPTAKKGTSALPTERPRWTKELIFSIGLTFLKLTCATCSAS